MYCEVNRAETVGEDPASWLFRSTPGPRCSVHARYPLIDAMLAILRADPIGRFRAHKAHVYGKKCDTHRQNVSRPPSPLRNREGYDRAGECCAEAPGRAVDAEHEPA